MTTGGQDVAGDRLAVLRPHLDDGVPLTLVAKQAGVPERTARRWLAAYRAGGPAALNRAPRSDRGRRRLPAELVTAIEGLALRRPPPAVAQVHRQAEALCADHGWAAPSYSTVRAIAAGLDGGLSGMRGSHPPNREQLDLLLQAARTHRPPDSCLPSSPTGSPSPSSCCPPASPHPGRRRLRHPDPAPPTRDAAPPPTPPLRRYREE